MRYRIFLRGLDIHRPSKSVHYLKTLQLVQKNQESYGYTLLSFGIGWLNYRRFYHRRILIWKNRFQEIEKDIERDLDSFHHIPEFPRFYYFFKKLIGTCKLDMLYDQNSQFLWEDAQKFIEKYPHYYPDLVSEKSEEEIEEDLKDEEKD